MEHVIEQGKLVDGARLPAKPFSPERLAAGMREALNSGMSDKGDHGTTISHETVINNTEPLRILVVDDDPGIADIIADVLREPGKTVHAAEDGASALKIAAELKPDVVLLDIKLPDIDGYELSRRIRELSGGFTPFIIAASGYTPERKIDEDAFDEYITKPIDFARLKEVIANRAV